MVQTNIERPTIRWMKDQQTAGEDRSYGRPSKSLNQPAQNMSVQYSDKESLNLLADAAIGMPEVEKATMDTFGLHLWCSACDMLSHEMPGGNSITNGAISFMPISKDISTQHTALEYTYSLNQQLSDFKADQLNSKNVKAEDIG